MKNLLSPPNPFGHEKIQVNDLMWSLNRKTNPFIINGLLLYEPCSIQELWDIYEEKSRTKHHRLRKLKTYVNGIDYWVEDPNFSVQRHIEFAPIGASPENKATRADVQKFLESVAIELLPSDRPLWRIYFIPYCYGNRSAFICRFHHVIADGIALMGLLFDMQSPTDEKKQGTLRVVGQTPQWQKVLTATLLGPFMSLRYIFMRKDPPPLTGMELMGKRKIAWSDPFPLEKVKKIKNHFNCSLNDVLGSCVAGAFCNYLKKNNFDPQNHTLKAVIPVNTRGREEMESGEIQLRNNFGTLILSLPIESSDPIKRLEQMKLRMDKFKKGPYAFVQFRTTSLLLKIFPHKYVFALVEFVANKCTVVFTNVPGPEHSLKMGNSKLLEIIPWVPSSGNLPWGFSVISYANNIQIGVTVDMVACDNPDVVVEAFMNELNALLAAVEK